MTTLASFMNYIHPSTGLREMVVGSDFSKVPAEVLDWTPGEINPWRLDAGGYKPHFLMWALAGTGHTVTLRYRPINEDTAKKFSEMGVRGACQWPSMSSEKIITAYVTYPDGSSGEWGSLFDVLGLIFVPGNKGFKRAQEIIRLARIWHDDFDRIQFLSTEDIEAMGLQTSAFDGISVISERYALRFLANVSEDHERKVLTHGLRNYDYRRLTTFRALMGSNITPRGMGAGMLKSDCIVVDDETLRARWGYTPDIVTWEGNVKAELGLSNPNGFFATWDPKKPKGPVTHDFQTKSWMQDFLDDETECCPLIDAKFDGVGDSLEQGKVPDWMIFDEDFYQSPKDRKDPWGRPRASSHANEIWTKSYLALQAAGLDIRMSAQYTSMMTRGVINHVGKRLKANLTPTGEAVPGSRAARVWAPAPWSIYGYAITDAFLDVAAGITFGNTDSTETNPYGVNTMLRWCNQSHSIVVPWADWHNNLVNTGGGDLDDRLCVMLRYHPETGAPVAVYYRQPNSAGEYILTHNIDAASFDWYNTEIDIPTLRLESTPVPASRRANGGEGILPEAKHVWGETYTPADAREAIEVALYLNRGVGQYINALIVANAMDADVNPHATPEQVIDVCQASPYREFFAWHEKHMETLWDQIILAAEEGKTLDYLLWHVKVPQRHKAKIRTHLGQPTKIYNHGARALKTFTERVKNIGFQLRHQHRHVEILEMAFADDIMAAAQKRVRNYMANYRTFRNKSRQRYKTNEPSIYGEVSVAGADALINNPNYGAGDRTRAYDIILAMYQVVNTQPVNRHGAPDPFLRYGIADNVIFNPPLPGHFGMPNLFIEACAHYGYAHHVTTTAPIWNAEGELIEPSTVVIEQRDDSPELIATIEEIIARNSDQ